VIAHKNSQSSGNVEIKFPTGYSISCKVNTFIKLENVKVDVEATFDKSSSIGGISYIDSVLGINSISVKNGHNIPLVYTSEANIEYVSYRFSDFGGDIDVENEDSDYNNFDNLTPDVVETLEFSSNSYIISASYLRSLQLIAPSKVGKTWVEITFAGKMLDTDGNFVDAYVRNYVCVEIYNPITAISVNTKYVKLYPYDEVGELNRELSETVLEVTLNNGGIAPTYKDIVLDYESVRNGVEIFKIERLETEGNRYQVRVLTRTYKEGEESIRETDATIFFSVSNFGVAYTTQVRLVFESPVLVEKIETVNVPQKGIYLSTVSDVVSEKTFKIMTNVLPADALNKNLIYRFEPDYGTREDIINISADGFVSIPEGSTVGGSGKILVIPADARMVGDDGEEYYRESVENVVLRIDIKVADGTSEETALEISSLEQIGENTHLHYLLLNDVSVTDIHFDTFSGGLYGQRGDNEFVATITKIGNNLFGTLENGAIVKNINFAGEFVNSNGAVADENYGNLENVNVNVYYKNDKFVGSTVSGAEVAGGLVGKNFGTISNCTFAGSVSATSVVGGLVGENSGSIISSNVEIYNMKDQAMTFAAPAVGGLVGKANQTSVVQKSYINNYSSTFVATTMGAFASIIENGAKFDKCFAYNVAQTLAFAQDNLNEDKITDSYVMYEKADGSWDYVAYMTRTDGSTARYENVTNYSYVSFGTSKTWNKLSTKNYGYPYLNEVEA
ncbi:MAG: hypothetical protein IJA69_00715, partial [Clostridia bacterium]|nr:hypothetical protein [Clostridia bacterium]